MSIKTNQTKIQIRRRLNENLTHASSVEMRYISPSGRTGSWPATIEDATLGHVIFNGSDENKMTEKGIWKVWAYVVFDDDRFAESNTTFIEVKDAGT
jgi:hypothetical protein